MGLAKEGWKGSCGKGINPKFLFFFLGKALQGCKRGLCLLGVKSPLVFNTLGWPWLVPENIFNLLEPPMLDSSPFPSPEAGKGFPVLKPVVQNILCSPLPQFLPCGRR